MVRIILATYLVLTTSTAHAICFSEPSAPMFGPPAQPSCSVNGSGYDRCDDHDIDRYRDDINDYLRRVDRYAEDAADYAECLADEATDQYDAFIAGY